MQQYQIGDYLNLNCTSGKSHPASVLQWYINDQPVSEKILCLESRQTPGFKIKGGNICRHFTVPFTYKIKLNNV